MIVRKFNIDELGLNYSLGINQIGIDLEKIIETHGLNNENEIIDFLVNLSEEIQNAYKDTMIQFFSDIYVLSQDHIITGSYYVQKAFYNEINISKSKNIEFLLYLSTHRQIKNAIESFGIKIPNLESNKLSYCIISSENNLSKINGEILQKLTAQEVDITLNSKTVEKFNRIKNFYEISDNQIKSVLNSYGFEPFNKNSIDHNLDNVFIALYDLVCEKMSLLSLEKIKID